MHMHARMLREIAKSLQQIEVATKQLISSHVYL